MQDRGPAAYIAEFLGTLLLVFFITAAVSLFATAPSEGNPNPFIDWSVIGLVHVLVLFILVQTLAVASGAHFNPAVTVAMTALRQIKLPDAGIYIVAQLAGAVAAALLTKLLFNEFPNADNVNFGATTIGDALDGKVVLGMIAEFIATFVLVWTIVAMVVNPQGAKEWAGLAIGGALGLCIFVMGPLTGGSLNPARSFGPALVSGEWGGASDFLLAYVLAPVLGGMVAALLYVNLVLAPAGAKGGPDEIDAIG